MSRSIVKFAAYILLIAALLYVGLQGLDVTDKVRIPGIMDEDGITQGLDLKGGTVIVYKAQTEDPSDEDMDTVVSTIRKRLDFQGYTEATVTRQGIDKIRVELPDVQNAEEVVETLGSTAKPFLQKPLMLTPLTRPSSLSRKRLWQVKMLRMQMLSMVSKRGRAFQRAATT